MLKNEFIGKEAEVEEKIRKNFEKDMSEFHRPTYYEFVEDLPLTAAGKVDFRKLEEMYSEGN